MDWVFENNNVPEVVWNVTSVADVKEALERTNGIADVFMLDGAIQSNEQLEEIVAALHTTSLRILA